MKSTSNDSKIIQINIIGDSLSERSIGFGLQNKLGNGYKINDFSVSGRNVYDWLLGCI